MNAFDFRDAALCRRLYTASLPLLRSVAARSGRSPAEREDLVQNAFLKLLESRAVFLNEAAARAFLVTCVRNEIIDDARKSKTRRTESVGEAVDSLDVADAGDTEHERAVALAGTLIDGIAGAPGNRAFALFYRDGLSAKEIAATTGEAVGSVTAKLCRLRSRHGQAIRACIEAAML